LKGRKVWMVVVASVVLIGIVAGGFWYHEQPQFCAVCHVMEPYLDSWEDSNPEPLLANRHAQEDVACLDCHEATVSDQIHELVVFVKQDYRTPLMKRNYPQSTCFECHLENEHTSYKEIASRTQDYRVDGDSINPHDTHLGEEECYRCHRMHSTSYEIEYCYMSCHHEETLASDCTNSGCHGAAELGLQE